jgi:hypothetical protein
VTRGSAQCTLFPKTHREKKKCENVVSSLGVSWCRRCHVPYSTSTCVYIRPPTLHIEIERLIAGSASGLTFDKSNQLQVCNKDDCFSFLRCSSSPFHNTCHVTDRQNTNHPNCFLFLSCPCHVSRRAVCGAIVCLTDESSTHSQPTDRSHHTQLALAVTEEGKR